MTADDIKQRRREADAEGGTFERCRDRVPYAELYGLRCIREKWLVCDRAEGHTGNHEATMPEGTRRQW